MVQSIEDYSLQNISNRINLRRSPASILYIRFSVFLRWAMHHVSMYFLRKAVFHFLPNEKRSCFRKKNPSFQFIQERSSAGVALFGKTIFSEGLKKISYFHVFFKKDHLLFSVRLGRKIIFSGKGNIIFPNNTRKIIFQRNCFGKTIFSGRLEKENMVFRAVSPELFKL